MFEKVEVRKRPGTVGICAAIMNHYKVDAVPHLICGGFTKRETEDALIDLNFIGVDNVLVLRGDAAKNETFFEPEPDGHRFAIDLLKQVTSLNNGIYLELASRTGNGQYDVRDPQAVEAIIDTLVRLAAKKPLVSDEIKASGISAEIKKEIWKRDKGKCANCGSTSHIQFSEISGKGGPTGKYQLICNQCATM